MSSSYEEPRMTNEELHRYVTKLLKTTNYLNASNHSDEIFGSNYYDMFADIGVVDPKRHSVGTPINNTINRYYDEKRNYSVLAPTLDPLNIINLSKRVKQSIQENDFSESLFFSTVFDKHEIADRMLEKNLVYSKRLEWMRINDIKTRPKFDQLIALNLLNLDKLDNILRYLTKHYILDKYEQTPRGKNFYTNSVFRNGAATTKIDFTDLYKCMNFPSNFNYYNFPSTELFSIIVRVDIGGPIQIGINEADNDLSAYIDLNVNEEHKIDNSRAVVKSLNIRANGSDSTVRIFGLF